MSRVTSSWTDLWAAPMVLASTAQATAETFVATSTVLSKRMPMLVEAMISPWTANVPELTLMVSEKMLAFKTSTGSASAHGKTLRTAMNGQVAAMKRLRGAGWLAPTDWMNIAERNIGMCMSLLTLPGEMLAPYHKGVTANATRLAD